jgi:hypothetical protein
MAGTRILEPRRTPQVRPAPEVRAEPIPIGRRPAYQAYRLLQAGFTVAPIAAGVDKFLHVLANWDMYLAPPIEKILPISGHAFMLIVGVVEIIAGLLVAAVPRIGGFIVGAWLCGIVINLVIAGNFYDVALRDIGLAVGAFALGLLAREFGRPAPASETSAA